MYCANRKRQLGCLLAIAIAISGCANSSSDRTFAKETTVTSPTGENLGQTLPISAIAKVKDTTIELEVARTPREQALGLMFRPPLPDNRGMLFPFDPPQSVSFWMKNVPVPLDMVFLLDGEIVGIAEEVPPCQTSLCPSYGPDTLVDAVIELRGGRARELGLDVGERIEISPIEGETPASYKK